MRSTEAVDITRDKLDVPLQAGELIALTKHLQSTRPDDYSGWRQQYGQTVGRLAADAAALSELSLDIFITDIDSLPGAYGEPERKKGRRIVGGTGSTTFDIREPVNYLDFQRKRISMGDPDYYMDDPHDYPPTVYRDIYPVAMSVGDAALNAFRRTLDPNNHARDMGSFIGRVAETLADRGSGLADFVEAAGLQRVCPDYLFPGLYDRVDEQAARALLGLA